jgi:hypothetical protein
MACDYLFGTFKLVDIVKDNKYQTFFKQFKGRGRSITTTM